MIVGTTFIVVTVNNILPNYAVVPAVLVHAIAIGGKLQLPVMELDEHGTFDTDEKFGFQR